MKFCIYYSIILAENTTYKDEFQLKKFKSLLKNIRKQFKASLNEALKKWPTQKNCRKQLIFMQRFFQDSFRICSFVQLSII